MSTKVGEIFAELSLDTDRFEAKVRESERRFTSLRQTADQAMRGVRQGATQASTGLDSVGDSAESARRAAQNIQLNRTLDRDAQQAATRMSALQREARQASTATNNIGMNNSLVRELQRAQQELGNLQRESRGAGEGIGSGLGSGITDRMSGALERAGGLAEGAGHSAGGGFLGSFGGRVSSLGTKAGPIGMALAGIAVVGIAAGAVLADAIADGMEQEANLDLIQAKLGIDEETTRRIGEASGMSFSNGWGESVAANMDGVRAAIQSGLLTGEEDTSVMKETIDQLNIVSSIMGEEVPAVARAAGQSIKNGIAKDGTEAFDLLTKSAQGSLNVSEDLLDSQVEYSTQLRALGLEGTEGWALVSQGVKAGARDTDVVIDALKEFKLRATDGTAAAAVGFDKLNLNAEAWGAAMNEGGVASRNAMADALRGLQAITNPTEKNAAALALFGTKFEDIQGAAFALNLDTAVQQFGNVEGATKKAGDTMSSNTAAAFTEAKNSIIVSADSIKLALAEAFGPKLQEGADWIAAHKPEIIGFFTDLATGALTCLDGMMAFSSGTLRALAFMQEGIGNTVGKALQALGSLASTVGGFLQNIPGFEDAGKAMEAVGNGAKFYGTEMDNAADQARSLADTIDAGRPVIQGMRDDVAAAGQAAQNTELMMRALGEGVNAVPDGKNIHITDTSPEAIARLEGLNLKTRTLEDGTVEVYADTAAGQQIIDDWIHQPRNTNVTVTPVIDQQAWANAQRAFNRSGQQGPVAPVFTNADGAVYEDHTAHIAPAGAWRVFAEPETGGEAYIPLAPSKRGRSVSILSDVAERFGMNLIAMADGGITGGGFDGQAAAEFFQAHDGEPYVYGALDCSGLLSAGFNAATGQNVRFVTGSDFASMGWKPGYDPNGFSIGTNGGVGENGHMAGTLYGTNVESDGSNGIQWGGTADGALDFPEVWHWPGASGGNDPSTERVLRADAPPVESGSSVPVPSQSSGTTDGQRVFVTNWPGGSSPAAPKSSTPAPTPQPEANTATHDISTGAGRGSLAAAIGAKFFANGGIENHAAQIANAGDMRVWAEPETGGEAYIPLGANKRDRSVALLKRVADQFGYALTAYVDGGFGGVSGANDHTAESWKAITAKGNAPSSLATPLRDTRLLKARDQAQQLAGFTAGAALAVASGFDENGFTGNFNTSNTSIPGLDKVLEELAKKIQPQPAVNIEHAEITADDPKSLVDEAMDPSRLPFMQTGI
ncbi:hypothetical protein ACNJ7E_22650 [Rhodococcus sp. NM-2]|uniref:hypothetical protein n=1 Tax=Rhodococcus sp. NM-2 TaxID=3401174 RepID=UPI003AAF0CFE